ncbi:MAG: PilT/PilU family type 4a pilus ATPase [Alphaproteobacteria bacterium]
MSEPAILTYLKSMEAHKASDLYLTVDYPVTLRSEKGFVYLSKDNLTHHDITDVLNTILTSRQRREYETTMELNTSLSIGVYGRFRVNVLRQKQFPAVVIRRITSKIPGIAELRLPQILETLALKKNGLVLVSGMAGSGKSTTLASMIDYRNTHEQGHIITIEDPVEYFHEHKKSVITQREVGVDTESYAMALKNALRQRPDVILVGEIRDREVMEQALMAAETGHLCLATIHTQNAYQAIERVVNMFSEDHVNQIRLNLSINLRAIISQRLIPSVDGNHVPAVEVMINQGHVRELILKGEIAKIRDIMEQTNAQGMFSFDQSLQKLYGDGLITEDVALKHSDKPSDLKIKLLQARLKQNSRSYDRGEALKTMDTSIISLRD